MGIFIYLHFVSPLVHTVTFDLTLETCLYILFWLWTMHLHFVSCYWNVFTFCLAFGPYSYIWSRLENMFLHFVSTVDHTIKFCFAFIMCLYVLPRLRIIQLHIVWTLKHVFIFRLAWGSHYILSHLELYVSKVRENVIIWSTIETKCKYMFLRRVRRYQMGNQNL